MFRNAARSLHLLNRDAATEREGVGLVAEGVYVGSGVLAADKNPGRSGARTCFVGAVLVLVVPMQEVGVAGLVVGGVDGHLRGARLLQIEDAVATDHAWHRISPTEQNLPTEDRPLPKIAMLSPPAPGSPLKKVSLVS